MDTSHEGNFSSMPTKQSYNANIKESREHETHELLYEFFDDYTYSGATFACFHLVKNKNKKKDETYLYLSMERGPQELESLAKILQWRLSGISEENGHKGGGNKRLIYGHNTSRVILQSVINEEEFIKAETKPDDIYTLSCDQTISERDFQDKVDKEYIKWPTDTLNLDEEGAWFNTYRTEMKKVGLSVDYVIRFTLSKPRKEYIDDRYWKYLIALIQMKNYDIPIYFKNEILGETEFAKYPNIDMIGLEHKDHGSEQIIELYLTLKGDFVLKNKEKYTNSKGDEITFNDELKRFGILRLYKINERYLKEQLSLLNDIIKHERKYNQEEFYGVYVRLNDKQTNYLPISEILQLSKNLGKELGSSCCRLVVEPTCTDDILEMLITTDTIKAKTRFSNINKAKKLAMELTRIGKMNICPTSQLINPDSPGYAKPRGKKLEKTGQCYVIYLGEFLYKYGHVTGTEKMQTRMMKHFNDSIKKVDEFCQIEMEEKCCKPLHYTTPLTNPKAFEERIGQLLDENCDDSKGVEKITLYQHRNSEHEQREYFTCMDSNYIFDVILPLILKEQQDY